MEIATPSNLVNPLIPCKILQAKAQSIGGYDYKSAIPFRYLLDYREAISKHRNHYLFLVEEFHKKNPVPPFKYEEVALFLKDEMGFYSEISLVDCIPRSISAIWEWESSITKRCCTILVNSSQTPERIKFTIAHELVHAIQDLDIVFRRIVEKLPESIRLKFIDRIADITASRFLAPPKIVRSLRNRGFSNTEIARQLEVSNQVIEYT
ncbi:MAG: ImmA/IrrE family metallo-endopeptidase [Patescibacteria group bacterium]